jgi:hypothetical protein
LIGSTTTGIKLSHGRHPSPVPPLEDEEEQTKKRKRKNKNRRRKGNKRPTEGEDDTQSTQPSVAPEQPVNEELEIEVILFK